MKKYIIFFLFTSLTINFVSAKVVGKVNYEGKFYFVDILPSGSTAVAWFRLNENSCANGDFKVMKMSVANVAYQVGKAKVCRAKKTYDNGKMIAGCTATLASGACVAAAVGTEGVAAVLCVTTWEYTMVRGLADCVDGVSGKIADYLALSPWAAYAVKAAIPGATFSKAIDLAIDNMCYEVK